MTENNEWYVYKPKKSYKKNKVPIEKLFETLSNDIKEIQNDIFDEIEKCGSFKKFIKI